MENGEWVNGILENINVKIDETLQFERFGFVRLDKIKKIKKNKKYEKVYEFWYAHP